MSEKLGRFTIVKHLKSGASGSVIVVKDPSTGALYAVKTMMAEIARGVVKELDIMLNKQIVSPFLLRYYIHVTEGELTRIFMEYCEKGDLYEYVRNCTGDIEESEILRIFAQIVKGISVLHNNGIVHRDIKHENILLNSRNEVKIADFGTINHGMPTQMKGTPGFMAFEVYGNEIPNPKSDIFALGVVMYFVATKRKPFESGDIYESMRKVEAGSKQASIDRPTDCSPSAAGCRCCPS